MTSLNDLVSAYQPIQEATMGAFWRGNLSVLATTANASQFGPRGQVHLGSLSKKLALDGAQTHAAHARILRDGFIPTAQEPASHDEARMKAARAQFRR